MKSRLPLSAAFIAFCMFSFTACNTASEQAAEVPPSPPIEITAVQLLKAFETNETEASAIYTGKTLIITGEVLGNTKKSDGSVEILLNSPESSIGSVRCHFPAEKAATVENIKWRDPITVKGICADMDSHVQVVINDCQLTSAAQEAASFNGKPQDHPSNKKALWEIGDDPTELKSFISDSGILYISVSGDTDNLDAYAQMIRKILEKHQSTIRWIKIIENDTMDPNRTGNTLGNLLTELKW